MLFNIYVECNESRWISKLSKDLFNQKFNLVRDL